jgi:large subunit ribosomal protein L23
MEHLHDVIKTIRLTEKATRLTELNNEYVFVVDRKADRTEIKQAVAQLFGKTVVGVRTITCRGKARRVGTKHEGRQPHFKKAIVRLAEGESLDLA